MTNTPLENAQATASTLTSMGKTLAGMGSHPVLAADLKSAETTNNLVIVGLTPAPTPAPPAPPPPSAIVPLGVPGNWTNVLNTEFPSTATGAAAIPAGWTYEQGAEKNGVPVAVTNFSQANGYGVLELAKGSGFEMQTTDALFLPGMCCEMVLNFSTWNNWAAGWSSGVTWPQDGEIDLAEVYNSKLQAAYHWGSSYAAEKSLLVGNYSVPLNTDVTFGCMRGTSTIQQYLNGVPFQGAAATDDTGLGHFLKLTMGLQSGTGVLGTTGAMRVKYVRAWTPA
jgi:hypothetical protein